ncbi:MAG: efflux transporter outer membrane subunit [Verrucomicrobiaceae bacterium]|nr:efflux transporter outer membrane subunit [Verrucomicrobiaceae bacterium]
MFKQVSKIGLCVALAGCNLAPKYLSPKPEVPAEFKTSGVWKHGRPAANTDRGEWWKIFGQNRLNVLETEATKANVSLEIASYQVAEARALAKADRAGIFPVLGVAASSRRTRNSGAVAINFGGGRTITRNRGTVEVSYEVDLWSRARNTAKASQLDAEAQEDLQQSVKLAVQAEVATTFFALMAQDEAIALLNRTLEVRKRAVELATARFKQGDTAQLDVAQAETDLAETEAEAIGLERRREELEHALAVLTGKPPAGFDIPSLELPGSAPSVPKSVPADLLQRRPDIAAAERQMAALNAEIGVAKAALFPGITLGSSGGAESSLVSNLASRAARVWGIGPELSWDLLSAGLNKAQVQAATARYDQAAAAYKNTVLQAMREVEDALSSIDVLRRQLASQQTTVAAAQKTVDLAQKRYDSGLVAYYEVLDARRTLLRAEQEATVIRGDLLTTTVQLIRALGGSW